MDRLQERIEGLAADPLSEPDEKIRQVVGELLTALEKGWIRSAARDEQGVWRANRWVKQGILLGFRVGAIRSFPGPGFSFFDKEIFPPQELDGLGRKIRIVPGGSAIRRGSHIGDNVICMPPMYVNVGAWVGEGTMLDSHSLVGSCGQVGRRVHLSAAAQIGGVLEPAGALPVIVEDDVLVGGGAGIYEGAIVRSRAVIGAGVVLTASTPVYDLVRETIYRAEGGGPLEIPEGAVVLPGTRRLKGAFALSNGLSIATPVIVKYRDAKTDAATALEEALRSRIG